MELRPYQSNIIAKARQYIAEGKKSILIQSATGSGKTLLTAFMLKSSASKSKRSLFLVHRRELINQSVETFDAVNLGHGIIASGYPPYPSLVQIGSVQTIGRRLHKIARPHIIIYDECHHITAGTWDRIYREFPEAVHVGLTATPRRLDGTGLINHFSVMINGPKVSDLIKAGYLSDYRLFAPGKPDTGKLHTRHGDYDRGESSQLMNTSTITGNAIDHYIKYANGKRAVCFCVSIEHSKAVVQEFISRGIPAEHVDGETPQQERDQAIKRFRDGKTLVISNVELFGEGFDAPSMEAAILLRPTQSLGLYLQQVGRALRPYPGKSHAIILDHAGNAFRHGLPDDEREWTLEGKKKSKKEASTVKECPSCYAVINIYEKKCRYCGHVFLGKKREINQTEGELKEIDKDELRRQRNFEQGKARTYEELVEVGKKRGYKLPHKWARYIYLYRMRKRTSNV